MTRCGSPSIARRRRSAAALAGTALGAAAFFTLAVAPARAQTTWTGATSTDWFVPGNWSSGVPGAGVATTIDAAPSVVLSAPGAATGNLTIGTTGSAALAIGFGTGAALTSSQVFLGSTATGSGSVVVGPGGSWTGHTRLDIGERGTGFLRIEADSTVSGGESVIGREGGSEGRVEVDGANALFSLANLYVGYGGRGAVVVTNGGRVFSNSTFIAGLSFSQGGSVVVSGPGTTWQTTGGLFVGERGRGSFDAFGGATITSGTTVLGRYFENGVRGLGIATVSGAGTIWTATDEYFVGRGGEGVLVVSDGARVQTPAMRIAQDSGSIGTLVIGAAAGSAPAAPGEIVAPITFGAGTGTIVFNHTSGDYVFASTLAGSGTIEARAGTTRLTGNSGGFTGTTTVFGGTLLVDGTLRGSTAVNAGATLGGTGTLGAATISAGGTLSPGDGIGTLAFDSLTMLSGSRLVVDASPMLSDLVQVSGAAALDGTVFLGGSFDIGRDLTILTAGSITGAFTGLDESYAFLGGTITTTGTAVTLRVDRDATFDSVTQTPNQAGVAAAIDAAGPGNPLYDEILLLDADTARSAFEQLSGDGYASELGGLVQSSGALRGLVFQRLAVMDNGPGASANGEPSAAYASFAATQDLASVDGPSAWVRGFGSWGRTGRGDAVRMRHDEGGVLVGLDIPVSEAWRVGILGGYSRANGDASNRAFESTSDNAHLGLYAGGGLGPWRLGLGATHTIHDVDATRVVAFGGFSDTLRASYRAHTTQVFGEAGYRLDGGAGIAWEPFVGLAHVYTRSDGFTESGGAAALTVGSSDTNTTFSTLGLRASANLELGGLDARLHGAVGWRHAFGDRGRRTWMSLPGTAAFLSTGTALVSDVAVLEAGVDVAVGERARLDVAYDGEIGSGTTRHGVSARLRVAF